MNVGSVFMDLVINQKQFNNQMNNAFKTANSTFSKIKKLAVAAFSVAAVKTFSSACESAYKDQIESERKLLAVMKMRETATKDSIKDILDLTSAEQNLGVVGDEVQLAGAQELSTYIDKADSIKKLIPQMNNMIAQQYGYNATQEEAVNIATMMGKVLEGQTGALSRYGYYFDENQEKILKFGTEEEKVATLTSIIHDSIGDVNQALGETAVGKQIQLANAWGDVKEQIGYVIVQVKQLLVPIFTVLVNVIGTAVGYLRQFLQALGFTAKNSTSTGSAIGASASAVSDYSDALDEATKSATKLKKAQGKMDELTIISNKDSSGSDSGSSSSPSVGGGGINNIDFNMGIDGDVEVTAAVQRVADFIKSTFETTKTTISNIWNSKPIQSFVGAAKTYGQFLYNYWTTMGTNLVTNVTNTWNNIKNNVATILGNMSTLWTTFWNDINIGIQTWGQPIIDGVSGIFNSIWQDAIDPAIQIISQAWADFSGILVELWDEYGKPLIDNIGEFVTTTIGLFQKIWDDVVEPIVTPFLEMLSWLWDEHLSGMVKALGEFIMKLVNGALEIYNKFIAPIVGWIMDVLSPIISFVGSLVVDTFGTAFGVISDVIGGILTALGGIIDFITGIFTGNWEKAWNGIVSIFKGIVDGIVGIFKAPINFIIDGINAFIRGLNCIKIPDWVPVVGGMGFHIDELPKLAQGGYVNARNPQLAIVGDNTREGEIIAPESKIYDQVAKAIKDSNGVGKQEIELHLYHHYEDGRTIIQKINQAQIDAGEVLVMS